MGLLERLITFALTQRAFVLVVTAALVAFGVRAVYDLPIEAFPDVQDVQVQIVTQVPGQAPEEVERIVSLPVEREMAGVPRLTQLRSVSITGLSVVTLTFADATDDYFARQQVLEKLQTVNLPAALQPQLGPLTTAVGEIYRYVLKAPPEMPATEVRALQDWVIRPALRMVPNVADVVSFGGAVKEYQVNVHPAALKRYGITLDQVVQAVGANGGNAGGALLVRGDEALAVRSIGLYGSADDLQRAVIVSREGKPVLVGDVADVGTGFRPLSGIVAYNERDDVVQGIVVMVKGGDAANVVRDIRQRVALVQGRLPAGVSIEPVYERTALIHHTVETVAENLLLGAGLVIGILLLFLRNWRAALIVGSVIPLALFAAFIMIDARGVSANLISLGAVDFGIIIDSAVVLVEALMVKLALAHADPNPAHHGAGWRLHALKNTCVELGHPILFSKAIIITAFLPIFTFQRVEGKIFAPVALTLSFALAGALLLTLTLVPALLSFVLERADMAETHLAWLERMKHWYRRFLEDVLAGRRRVAAAASLILAASLAATPWLGSEFLPKLDEGNIWLTIALPPATALQKTKDVERAVRAILRDYPEVRQVISQVGRPDDGTDPKGPNNLEILADLQPRSRWRFASKDALIADMSARIHSIPGLPTNFSQVIQDNVEEALSGTKGEIVVKVYGQDLAVLEDLAGRVVDVLNGVRGATDVAAFRIGGQSEVDIELDRMRLARLGITVADANAVVQTALAGNPANAFYEADRRFDIVVRVAKADRDAVDDIANLQVALPGNAGSVALSDIAHVQVRQGAARISREAGGRMVAIKVNLTDRDQGGFVAEAQDKVAAAVPLPPGYALTWGGQFENQRRAAARLRIIVPISALLIFSLLFWAFRSVRRSLMVLAMVPFTLVGGIAGLALAGLHLSVSAAVGFIAVAGISVQNGVIMVEHIMERLRAGHDATSAVVEGAVARLRPIIMTALMAGLGLLPAALSHGIGSETQRPFAVVIVGGIVSGTLFTLALLPLLFDRLARPAGHDA